MNAHEKITNFPETTFYTEIIDLLHLDTSVIMYKELGIPILVGTIEGGRSFTIKAFLDIGVGVSVLPYSLYNTLNIPPYTPINLCLKLAYASYIPFRGVVEDVRNSKHFLFD